MSFREYYTLENSWARLRFKSSYLHEYLQFSLLPTTSLTANTHKCRFRKLSSDRRCRSRQCSSAHLRRWRQPRGRRRLPAELPAAISYRGGQPTSVSLFDFVFLNTFYNLTAFVCTQKKKCSHGWHVPRSLNTLWPAVSSCIIMVRSRMGG